MSHFKLYVPLCSSMEKEINFCSKKTMNSQIFKLWYQSAISDSLNCWKIGQDYESRVKLQKSWPFLFIMTTFVTLCPNASTNPLRQWGFLQCLIFSSITLRVKYYWHPIAVMGVVDMFEQCHFDGKNLSKIWLALWEIWRHQKFILRLTDL